MDVERNLRAPVAGIAPGGRAAWRRRSCVPELAIRTGDTPSDARARMQRHPPDILITTPESLFLLLTSRAGEMLRTVETVIVDEIHALVGTKRGAHLAAVPRAPRGADRPGPSSGSGCPPPSGRSRRWPATWAGAPEAGRGGLGRSRSWTQEPGRPSTCGSRFPSRTCRDPGSSRSMSRARPWRGRPPACSVTPSGRPSTPACSSSCARTARRSCSSTADGSPSGSRRALNELAGRARSPAPTTARSPASSGCEIEDALKGGRLPGDRGHLLARAGHRHGSGRSRGPDRDADLGGQRHAADRAGEPPGRGGVARASSSPSTGATSSPVPR